MSYNATLMNDLVWWIVCLMFESGWCTIHILRGKRSQSFLTAASHCYFTINLEGWISRLVRYLPMASHADWEGGLWHEVRNRCQACLPVATSDAADFSAAVTAAEMHQGWWQSCEVIAKQDARVKPSLINEYTPLSCESSSGSCDKRVEPG